MRLLLIRHGQTPDNVRGALGTVSPGPALTALGRRQAAALPHALQEPLAALAVSTLVRTQLTAAPLAAARSLEPAVFDGLREIEAGALEGRTDRHAVRAYLDAFTAWASGDLEVRIPGAENGYEFFARYDAALAESAAVAADGTLAIVSHGAAIRTWVGLRARNVDASFTREHQLENTGLVALEGDIATGWTLLSWQGEPIGGESLADSAVPDPTGKG